MHSIKFIVLAALFLINPGSLALIDDVNQDGRTNIGNVIVLEEMIEVTTPQPGSL